MLQCPHITLKSRWLTSLSLNAPCTSAKHSLSRSFSSRTKAIPLHYPGQCQHQVFWPKTSDDRSDRRPNAGPNIRYIHTDTEATERVQEAKKHRAHLVNHPPQVHCLSSADELEELVSASKKRGKAQRINAPSSRFPGRPPGRSSMNSASSESLHHEGNDHVDHNQSLDSSSAVPNVKNNLPAKNGRPSCHTPRAERKRSLQRKVLRQSDKKSVVNQGYSASTYSKTALSSRHSRVIGTTSRNKRTRQTMRLRRMLLRKKMLRRRTASIRLPAYNPWTQERLLEEDNKRKLIIRNVHNIARRLENRKGVYLKIDPEVIEDEVARRKSSLYPYTRHHFNWYFWFRRLVVPSRHRDPTWTSTKLKLAKRLGALWIENCIGSKDFSLRTINDWPAFPLRAKRKMWPSAMLQCLMTSAQVSLTFLENTLPASYPSFEMLTDSLWAIKRLYPEELVLNRQLQAKFDCLMQHLFDFRSWPFEGLSEQRLGLILEHTSPEQTSATYSRIVEKKLRHFPSTMLRLMDKFTEAGDVEKSLEALYFYSKKRTHDAVREKHMSTPHVLKRCTNLLRLDFVKKQGNSQNFKILTAMLEMGINPDQILYNVVMDNAFKNDVSDVGWDVFRFLKENNLPRDSYSYVALLKDGVRHQNATKITELLTEVFSDSDLEVSDHLLSYILHVVRRLYWLRGDYDPAVCYSTMLAVYSRYRNLVPLLKLGMHDGMSQYHERMPSRQTLGVLFVTFILSRKSSGIVRSAYHLFRHLLHMRDAHARMLAETDHIYNAFISRLGQHHRGLPECVGIVRDMLQRPEAAHIRPTHKTYEVLISACIKHGEIETAEQIRLVMRSQGLEETTFIRENLATGYLSLGRTPMAMRLPDVRGTAFWELAEEKEESSIDSRMPVFDELNERLKELRLAGRTVEDKWRCKVERPIFERLQVAK